MISALKNVFRNNLLLGAIFLISIILGPGISYGGFYFLHLVLIVMIPVFILNIELRDSFVKALRTPLNLILILTLVWAAASILWAENKSYALTNIAQLGIGVLVVLLCQIFIDNKATFEYYKKNILFPMFLLVLGIALLEIYSDFRWPISSISHNNHWFGRENVVIENIKTEQIPGYLYSSPTAFFWNPNNLSVFLCLFIPFLMRNNWKNYILFIIAIIVITQTSSRFSIISLAFILCGASLIYKKNIRFFGLFLATLFVPMIFFGTSLLAIKANEPISKLAGTDVLSKVSFFGAKANRLEEEEDNSQSIRKQLYIQGFQYIQESKLLGVGAGNAKWLNYKQKEKTKGITSVHFYWLELVINGGIIMGVLMILYFTKIIVSLWRLRRNELSQKFLMTLLLFGMAVISLSSAHYFLPYYAFLGLLSAWINLNNQDHEKDALAG